MIIKLLEQPIIAIKEALIVGHVKGMALEANKAAGIYALADNVCYTIPMAKAHIGPDAIMVSEVSEARMIMHPAEVLDSMTEVFNHQGVHMGSLIAVEIDENRQITALYTERFEFPFDKVTQIGDVIMADVAEYEVRITDELDQEAEKLKSEVDAYIDYNVVNNYKTLEPLHNETFGEDASEVGFESPKPEPEIVETIQKETVEEFKTTLRTVQEFSHHDGSAADNNRNVDTSFDKKYQYLCGKKLIENIDIGGMSFEKGSEIDPDLIKCAIENNSIVKVIMNAED